MPTAEELAYIAGFVDGEGCIGIHQWKKGSFINRSIRVILTNTDPSVLRWIQDVYGGSLRCTNPVKNWNIRWELCLSSRKASAFLVDIQPYLRMKNKQAEMCLLFQSRRILSKNQINKTWNKAWDESLIDAIHKLDRRGTNESDASR